MKKINVLSLFDGISCAQIALDRAGIKVDKYFASEIDKYAIDVTQHNWPNTIQLGDITKWKEWDVNWAEIDLVCAGSPCQGFSMSGKRLNFEDPRSKLFFVFAEILEHIKSLNQNFLFLLENVKMKKESENVITNITGVSPIEINSSLVSAQNRKRLYWTNISGVKLPEDRDIKIKDIIEENVNYEFVHQDIYKNGRIKGNCWQYDGSGKGHDSQNFRAYFLDGKMACLSYSAPHGTKILTKDGVRKTTRTEHERLQTVPDGYTNGIKLNNAKAALGNGWTVDVIKHIFSFLPKEYYE